MKSTKTLICKAALVVATLLTQCVRAEGPVMAGPRALEESPRLARPIPYERRDPSRVPASITNDRALLASPRILEEYPQLARSGYRTQAGTGRTELEQILQNVALANSPRMREEYPRLARKSVPMPDHRNPPSRELLGNANVRR